MKTRLRTDFEGLPWLGDLPRRVSSKCLDLIIGQHRIVRASIEKHTVLKPCIKSFRTQYGLPYSHKVAIAI